MTEGISTRIHDEVSKFIETRLLKGSELISPETILRYLPHLSKRGYVIILMEAAELDDDGMQTPNFEYAVLGLDKSGDDDWESHHDAARITKVVTRRLERAVASPKEYVFEVYIDDIPNTLDTDTDGNTRTK